MSKTKGQRKKQMGKISVRKNGRLNTGKIGYSYTGTNKTHKHKKGVIASVVDADEPVIPKRQLKTKKCVVCHTDDVLPGMSVCSKCFDVSDVICDELEDVNY